MSAKIFRCALFLGILLTGMTTAFNAVNAVSEASLYVDPPKVEGTTYIPPQTFTVSVLVANVTSLRALRFNMSFSPEILGILSLFLGALEYSPSPNWQIDGQVGFLWFEVSYNIPISTESPIAVANVTFIIRGRGATPLDLHDTSMSNTDGQPISHTIGDGYFKNFDPYDLNFDGKIDIDDLTIVALAFGSFPGHPRWNPSADVNKDGIVDITDLVLVATRFGEGV